ncbi:hypothetical protein Ssi02_24310 [Sinosporangium siamense]|uniref:Uncharacterized protein n=1 Tax=Sinosporangium siamense TaxID=1367973 RepID=A0A919RE37_9ACTN|nr:hypothetical protein Ssi02_24310 [Sinosporangium siamense]
MAGVDERGHVGHGTLHGLALLLRGGVAFGRGHGVAAKGEHDTLVPTGAAVSGHGGVALGGAAACGFTPGFALRHVHLARLARLPALPTVPLHIPLTARR